MAFLLDSIKGRIGTEDDGSPGFEDMNYLVGNTSGMDIGQVPSPIDQRIGRMSQIGGEIMELQITNPTTFQIDRRELLNVINRLGIDVTLHGDPNIGFTSAYATGGRTAGFNIVHRYMKRYIEQMAAFKWEVEKSEDLDFHVGYVNMHASNEQIPAREERLAQDVSVDPFGEQMREMESGKKYNIYKNEDFMEDFFDYWLLQVVEQPSQIYEGIFSDLSEDFRDDWNKAKGKVCDGFYKEKCKDVRKKAGLLQTAAQIDQGVEIEFLERSEDFSVPSFKIERPQTPTNPDPEPISIDTLSDLQQAGMFQNVRQLSRDIYQIREGKSEFEEINSNSGKILSQLEKLIDSLWGTAGEAYLSTEAKQRSLVRNLDIENQQILEKAADAAEEDAQEAFAHEEWDIQKRIMERLQGGRYGDDLNKESRIFFHIMPAWMQNASEGYGEDHPGWEAPEYIWNTIVGETFDDYEDFQDFLDRDRENELEVIAAVGCAYIWGHWTQIENNFDIQAFEGSLRDIDIPDLKGSNSFTWTEWMNKFGLKLNIEAMYGDPGSLRRVWRPKDIAVACRAINKTAKKQSEEWEDEYKGKIAKFTIDMEHTASYGVDPFREIERLIEQEEETASETDAEDKKPLSDIVKTYHLTKPGWEKQQGHRHGPFARGDVTLYTWLYKLIEAGFARNPEDKGIVMFEVGGEYREEMYVIRVAMDMIERGIKPDDLDPNKIPLDRDYETPEEALMARFFGLDRNQFNSEMAKIEEHAFDPLDGLLEAEGFDYTWSSSSAIQNDNRPGEWKKEEYK